MNSLNSENWIKLNPISRISHIFNVQQKTKKNTATREREIGGKVCVHICSRGNAARGTLRGSFIFHGETKKSGSGSRVGFASTLFLAAKNLNESFPRSKGTSNCDR